MNGRIAGARWARYAATLAWLALVLVPAPFANRAGGARGAHIASHQAYAARGARAAPSTSDFARGARAAPSGTIGARASCSPREPFSPPVVARLPVGAFALDARRGVAVVASSAGDARATTVSLAAYDERTGAPIRARRVTTAPIARAGGTVRAVDDIHTAIDEATGRLFLLHMPSAPGARLAGRVDVFDGRTLALLRTTPVGDLPLPPALDARTGRVFVANQGSGTVSVLDARTGRLLRTVVVSRALLGPSAPVVVDEGTDRAFFAMDTGQGGVAVLDARSGRLLQRVAVADFPQAIAVDAGNGHVLVAGRAALNVLDARDGHVLRTVAMPATPGALLVDEAAHRAFISYTDDVKVSMLDTATGAVLRTVPVRLDYNAPGQTQPLDQAENETYPIVERVDKLRRWVVVRVPQVMDDDGPEQGPSQITVLDSRTATRVHTVFSEPAWPDAIAVDDRRGRAFSAVGDAIDLYDISCLTTYYIFGDLG